MYKMQYISISETSLVLATVDMAHHHSSFCSLSTAGIVDTSNVKTGTGSHVVVKGGVVYYKPAKMFLKVSSYELYIASSYIRLIS